MNIKPLVLSFALLTMPFAAFAEMVNINQADAATFQHYLKGVGQKKAERIVQYRSEHKEFKSLDEIMEVKGIGEGIFKKIKADLSLEEGKVSVSEETTAVKKVEASTQLAKAKMPELAVEVAEKKAVLKADAPTKQAVTAEEKLEPRVEAKDNAEMKQKTL